MSDAMARTTLETSIRDLALTVFRRKWSILAIFALTMASAIVYVELIRDTAHVTSAKLLVKLGQEQAAPPTVLGATPMIVSQRYQEMNSEIDILLSNDLLARVVDDLHMDQPPPPDPVPDKLLPRVKYETRRYVSGFKAWINETLISIGMRERLTQREQAIAALKRMLLVTSENDSNVILVRLLSPVRQGASKILNHVLDEYLQYRITVHQNPGAVSFFDDQTQESLASLKDAEAQLAEFETRSGIRLLDQQKSVLLDQIAGTEAAVADARLDLERASSKVGRLEEVLRAPEPDFAFLGAFKEGTFPDSLLRDLVALRQRREKLKLTELDDGLLIQNERAQFDALMGMVASHLRSVLQEKQAAYDTHVATLASRQDSLAALHAKENEWGALRRRVRLLEDAYTFNAKKLEEASTIHAMELMKLGNVAVIERAIDPLEQAGTRKLTLLGVSAVLAVFASLAWAALAEFFDHRIYSAEQLERHVRAPVAAVVPIERRVEIWRR